MNNHSNMVNEFILVGFVLPWFQEMLLFVLLLVIFLLTVTGNLLIITLVCADHQFHTPMYFFLCNLSILEILFILCVTPEMLQNLLSHGIVISFWGCVAQTYFYFFLGTTELFLIAAMSFDRYTAICYPLHYSMIMSGWLCALLVLSSWVGGSLFPLFPLILMIRLPFCGPNKINHFFCDYAPLVQLSCTDTRQLLAVESAFCSVVLFSSLTVTLVSYTYIIITILRIPSATGRQKAFSTCASHITVASIFYGSTIFMYSLPSQERSPTVQKAVAMLTSVLTPLLNPFIYTLKNQKVKEALRTSLRKGIFKP
ncbi:olfactory receptor 6M1-like [Alligator sinensis]|uniref:Olfactory receptor n=1 Tax=Alligator sinensis TaxID=38654 RepID=A0A1U7SKL9_ALLSI|nr:olfactory receptor 6M1-like [Alligator sinensis]